MKRKIVVADNNLESVKLIKKHYEARGCEVFLCQLLQECVDLLNKHNPQIVFLGYNQSEGNGWELAPVFENAFPMIWSILMYDTKAPHQFPLNSDGEEFPMMAKPIQTKDLDKILDGYHFINYLVYDAKIQTDPDAELLKHFNKMEEAVEFMKTVPRKTVVAITSNMWDQKTKQFVMVDMSLHGDKTNPTLN